MVACMVFFAIVSTVYSNRRTFPHIRSIDWKSLKFGTAKIPERAWTKIPPVEPLWPDTAVAYENETECEFQMAQFSLGLWGLRGIPRPLSEPSGGDDHVRVAVYDIGGKNTGILNSSIRKELPLIPHVGVRVFGKEFFFSDCIEVKEASSIRNLLPCDQYPQILFDFGRTLQTSESIEDWMGLARDRYNVETYNLWSKNCNHFADEFATFLLPDVGIPSPILMPILDITDSMMDSVPTWRRSVGLNLMNDLSRLVMITWGLVVKRGKSLQK